MGHSPSRGFRGAGEPPSIAEKSYKLHLKALGDSWPLEDIGKAWYSGICTQPSRVVGGGEGWRRFMEWRTADSRPLINKQTFARPKSDLGLAARIALSRG